LGIGVYGLAERLHVSHQTVRNMLEGDPVGGATVAAVLHLFPDLRFEDLFTTEQSAEAKAQ